jgi:hypothetical protein
MARDPTTHVTTPSPLRGQAGFAGRGGRDVPPNSDRFDSDCADAGRGAAACDSGSMALLAYPRMETSREEGEGGRQVGSKVRKKQWHDNAQPAQRPLGRAGGQGAESIKEWRK